MTQELEQRIEALYARVKTDIKALEERMLSEFAHRDKALDLAREELKKELSNLNELRREVTDDRSRLMTKEGDRMQIDASLDNLDDRLTVIERQQVGLVDRMAAQRVNEERISQLEAERIRREGRASGVSWTTGKIIAGVGLTISVIGIVVVLANYLTS